MVVRVPGLRVLLLLEIQLPELLKIGWRWIVHNGRFQVRNACLAVRAGECLLQQPEVGNDFHHDIHQRPHAAAHENNQKPIPFRPALHRVNQRQHLQDDPAGVKQQVA